MHTLTLDDCCVYIPNYPKSYGLTLRLQNTEKVSLTITSSSQVISYLLSCDHFYESRLTEMIFKLSFRSEETSTPLEIDTARYPVLESMKISAAYIMEYRKTSISPSAFCFNSSNLSILSFEKVTLSDEAMNSLICYLQSPHCQLHSLTLSDCEYCPHQYGSTFTLNLMLPSKLAFAGSNDFLSFLLSKFHFITQLLTEFDISLKKSKVIFKAALSQYTMAESFKFTGGSYINQVYLSFLNFNSQPNRLHTLSFSKCYISTEDITVLVDSLKSQHCKLQLLNLDECIIPDAEFENDEKVTTFRLQLMKNSILNIEGSCHLTLYMLSKFDFITQTLTELKLIYADLDQARRRSVAWDYMYSRSVAWDYSDYEDLQCYPLPSTIFDFITKLNYLHTLSISGHIFSVESTEALARSLQSQHCKILKLTLYNCTIPASGRTGLTRAIVSSTTIKHLLFQTGDSHLSLDELVSGLKQNKIMEELAVCSSFGGEDRFQVFKEAIDQSTVKKLWLDKCYKSNLASRPLLRKDVKIEWNKYRYGVFLIEKWYDSVI